MLSRSTLVLCDTGIVIELWKMNIWDKVIAHYSVVVSQKIVDEARFYYDSEGLKKNIDLSTYASAEKISVIDPPASQLEKLSSDFDPTFQDRFDPGESTLLCQLLYSGDPRGAVLCSADSIVFRALGSKLCSAKGISLEELLQAMGMARKLDWKFTKEFRESWSRRGFAGV